MAMSIVVSVLSSTAARAGSIYYDVVIDTTSFSGQSGHVEFQLGTDPGNVSITAAFSNYTSDAMLNGPTMDLSTGTLGVSVNGDLSSTGNPLSMYNDGSNFQIADADQLVKTFGTHFDFGITLSGDGIGTASSGTASLAISLFDLSYNPFFNGPDATNNAVVFIQTSTDGTSTLTQYQLNSVPEPSSFVSMLLGVFGMGVGMYRRQKRAV